MRGAALGLLLVAAPAVGQDLIPPPSPGPKRLSGPRTGVTLLSPRLARHLAERSEGRLEGLPILTQMGWQVETRAFQLADGLTGMTEAVILVGGLERGLAIPSTTFLAGLRTPSGAEVGVGPNLTISWGITESDNVGDAGSYAAVGLAVAAGLNHEVAGMNLPVNVAAVFGENGPRLSVLVGFTVATRHY